MHFEGKTVVLTGVGRKGQVGEAVARAFAEHGARLVLVDRTAADVEARAESLRAGVGDGPCDVRAFTCDLTDGAQTEALAGDLRTACGGRIHALVHLAGGFASGGRVDGGDVAVWHRMLAINLTTAYLTTRALLPLLRSDGGAIVYFSSVAALPGGNPAGMASYAASKAGVIALMRAVSAEERASRVRANALAPIAIRTAENLASMGADARYVEREQVADAVLFLCSDAASAITGQVVALG